MRSVDKMTKQEVLDSLERIKDSMDMDFLNRQEIEGIVKDIIDLQRNVNSMFAKMQTLLDKIEEVKGPNMDIDDREYRWVKDRLEYWLDVERLITKKEMIYANSLWDKYGK